MKISRRDILAAGAAAPVAVALVPRPGAAHEAAAQGQVLGVQRFAAGGQTVTALLDGHLTLGAELFSNLTEEEAARLLHQAFREEGPVPAGINAYVVKGGGETTLIDAGGRGVFEHAGELGAALDAAGFATEDIGRVLVTHLHPDHIGGLAEGGEARFPNATLHVHQADIDYWTSQQNRDAAAEQMRGMFDLARATLDAYGDRLTPFDADGEVAAGISAMHLPGHTPGHTGYVVGGGGDALTVWGDIVHVEAFQFPKPEAAIGFDVNPEQAIETRRAIFRRAADERSRVAGMHLAFPGVGHVVEEGESYRFAPARWTFALG